MPFAKHAPPIEVVICDSSPDWQLTATRVKKVVEAIAPTTRICYLGSPKAQQTIQRNIAIQHSSADILFMIDDDAYLSRDAARRILSVYEADHDGEIAAVGIGAMKSWNGFNASNVGSLDLGGDGARNLLGRLLGFWAWAHPKHGKTFAEPTINLPLIASIFIAGFQITVRRTIANRQQFDENLVSGHFEDSDASFRFAQEGGVVLLAEPLLFHAAAPRPAGEARRGILARFGWILNISYLNRKYFGGSFYVRAHCLTQWIRWIPVDLIVGLARRDFSRLTGGLLVLLPLLRLCLSPQERIGSVVVEETEALKRRLRHRT